MTGETPMNQVLASAALAGFALSSAPGLARPLDACVPAAERAALVAVDRTPAIGQTYVAGSPFAVQPRVLRVEVDVFGPQSLVYRADVTLNEACEATSTDLTLENNPWYRW